MFALVARRHEISRGQLWKWRGQVRRGELAMVLEFIPVWVQANAALSMPQAAGKSASMNDADTDLAPQPRPSKPASLRRARGVGFNPVSHKPRPVQGGWMVMVNSRKSWYIHRILGCYMQPRSTAAAVWRAYRKGSARSGFVAEEDR